MSDHDYSLLMQEIDGLLEQVESDSQAEAAQECAKADAGVTL